MFNDTARRALNNIDLKPDRILSATPGTGTHFSGLMGSIISCLFLKLKVSLIAYNVRWSQPVPVQSEATYEGRIVQLQWSLLLLTPDF